MYNKVGKGLLKDEKAQKLALRHWLEAVSFGFVCLTLVYGYSNVLLIIIICFSYRLTHVIGTDIIYTYIMMSGRKAKVLSHFSSGKFNTNLSIFKSQMFLGILS